MISYIAASHKPDVLADNLEATLRLEAADELVVVTDPPSIATAYNIGQADALNPIRCYLHSDVQVIDPLRLRAQLIERCTVGVGIVGLIGSATRVLPWWNGDKLGSVVDARMGTLDFGPGGECAYLDGLLLATAQTLTWDEGYGGFHLYDHDICRQMLERGLPNLCLTGGAAMVRHNTSGPANTAKLNGWEPGVARFHEKWGVA